MSKKNAGLIEPETALCAISFSSVYDNVVYPQYEIIVEEGCDLGVDDEGQKILGEYDPLSNIAYIDDAISEESNDPRRTFTLWHEVGGHGVLQDTVSFFL